MRNLPEDQLNRSKRITLLTLNGMGLEKVGLEIREINERCKMLKEFDPIDADCIAIQALLEEAFAPLHIAWKETVKCLNFEKAHLEANKGAK